ncbi:MAG: hypothetical protein ACR2JI_01310 [Mycobacterium sp.]
MTQPLTNLIARLDEACAWLEVHPPVHPVTRRVAVALEDMRAVIDSGSGPTESAAIQSEVLAAAMPGEDEQLADLVREIGALWRGLMGVPGGRSRRRGPSQAPVFVIAGGRPVRSVPMIDGGLDILAFDPATGRLVRDMGQLEAVVMPAQAGAHIVDVKSFYDTVDALRREHGLRTPEVPTPAAALGTPIDWLGTGAATQPYRAAVGGDEWLIRVNDWPDEPSVYTMFVNGREAFGFDGWPDTWSRP